MGGHGPVAGAIRELRIRWRLFRRSHSPTRRHLALAMAALAVAWIGLALYHGLGTDAQLHRQLLQLQQQSQGLSQELRAQRQELSSAASRAGQEELARSEGLSTPGEQVYVVENPVRAAGPATMARATTAVGQSAQGLAQSLLGLP